MERPFVQVLHRWLGPPAARLMRSFPPAWRSTPRRRRFLFLGICAPGFLAVVILRANPLAVLAGMAWMLLAGELRRFSEPELIREGGDGRLVHHQPL